MAILYRTRRHGDNIEAFEVTRRTASTVWYTRPFGGVCLVCRERVNSDHQQWHDTWEEARDHMLRFAEQRLAASLRSVDMAKAAIERIKALRKDAV
jgi:hypothetical protein